MSLLSECYHYQRTYLYQKSKRFIFFSLLTHPISINSISRHRCHYSSQSFLSSKRLENMPQLALRLSPLLIICSNNPQVGLLSFHSECCKLMGSYFGIWCRYFINIISPPISEILNRRRCHIINIQVISSNKVTNLLNNLLGRA